MNLSYTNNNYRRFLRRHIKNTTEFAKTYHYNHRNMRRWLYNGSFPRPPMIALLNKQISEFYKLKLSDVLHACHVAQMKDMQDYIMRDKI